MSFMINMALSMGFTAAAYLDVKDLVVVPAYRGYCQQNTCGNYDKLPVCPPTCGTVEDMTERIMAFEKALILQTEYKPGNMSDMAAHKQAKHDHNVLTDELIEAMKAEGLKTYLCMSAGPWKTYSCLSAYSVDAQKMAEAAGMTCWAQDGKGRCFSVILLHEAL